jgi:branched-chain amino acid transport system permease protein/neutral amino acid transport system permease protein
MPAIGFGLVSAALLAIAAVGFTLQFGITNVLNLSYGSMLTVGAFSAYVLTVHGVNIWLALCVAGAIAAVLSVLLNRLIFTPFARRGTGLFGMIIVTVSVQLIIEYGLQSAFGTDFMSFPGINQGETIYVLGMIFTQLQLIIVGVALLGMFTVYVILQYTRLGTAMRATATNPGLARNAGVPTKRIIDATWLLSGALCGISGVTLVLSVQSFDFTIGQRFLITIVAAAVLGGIGQPYGAMLGALTVALAGSIVANFSNSAYNEVTAFAILIAVLLIRPQGILSEIATAKEVVT